MLGEAGMSTASESIGARESVTGRLVLLRVMGPLASVLSCDDDMADIMKNDDDTIKLELG